MARRPAGPEQTLGDERALERWDERLYGVGVADVDLGGAAGQREHAVDVWAAAHEDQPAAVLPGAEAGVDDGVHAGAVHEGELAQVEHGEVRQLLRLVQCPRELWCRRDIQLEKTMIELERTTIVQETRSAFQNAMQHKFISAIERLSGRGVLAFISNHHVGPDMEIELFLLHPEPSQTVESPAASI
jgi:hypothetical protein